MLVTIKLGGTSVGDAERIRASAEQVKRVLDQGHQVVVVTSAMAGVTNKLVGLLGKQTSLADTSSGDSRVAEFFRFTRQLEQDHLAAARGAIRDPKLLEEVANALYVERSGLDRILLGSHLLGELTPMGYDFVVSEGERLCVPILSRCLRDLGVDAIGFGGDEAGIATDNNYGNSLPNEERTREGVRRALQPVLRQKRTPVVAGFYGRSEQGRIAILGRGGSDFTATLIGSALDADEIWILKQDVDGIKTTDPRLVPRAYTIANVSYSIAAEMALLGAKVLHPKSVQPAARQNIPVRIASTSDRDRPGTRLTAQAEGEAPGVTALTLVRPAALVRVSSPDVGDEGIIRGDLVPELRRQNLDVLASATGFNGSRFIWLVAGADLERFRALLQRHVEPRVAIEDQRVAVLGIVGKGVAATAGILARSAGCLARAGAEPLAVLLGASTNGIVIALPDDERRLPQALQALHTELGLDRQAGA
jgi:aspartate kinase